MGARQETAGVQGATGVAIPPHWGWWASRRPMTLAIGSGSPSPGRLMATPLGAGPSTTARPSSPPQTASSTTNPSPAGCGSTPCPRKGCSAVRSRSGRPPHQLLQPAPARARPPRHPPGGRGGGPGRRSAAHHGLLRQSLLRRLLSAEQVALLESAARTRVLPAHRSGLATLGHWLDGLLARTHQAPEMLCHPAAVHALEQELVMGLVGGVRLPRARVAGPGLPAPPRFRPGRRVHPPC